LTIQAKQPIILLMSMSRTTSIPVLDGIHLDRRGQTPIYAQVAAAIRERIQSGRLAGGAKLPATRELADALRVNRATAVEAYRLLREDGWVRSGVGSGTFVVARESDEAATPAAESSFWSLRLEDLPRPEHDRGPTSISADTIRLTSPTADPAAFPLQDFREVLDEIFRREGSACLDYGPPDGYPPLREILATRLERQGVHVDPSQVLLTNGSQQGLELIFRLLAPPGRTLLIEEPTYPLALRTARALKLSVRSVPLDDEGLRLDLLARILDETRAGMLYTMPVFQNPTGLTLSRDRRARLLALAAERGLPIVEDHFDADLDYKGDAPPPLLAEGSPPNVVVLGTFSKILFPGLRVGWIVMPEPLIGPLSEMKVCADLSGGLLTQMALYEFCRRGLLDAHLERIRERNGARLAAMLSALDAHMPSGVRWTRPTGGMCLWVRLPKGLDADEVAGEALRRGVAVSPGTAFHTSGGGWDGLRLCFIREDDERIRAGIRLLAGTIEDGISRRPARESEGAAAPIL
jgi:GntR family transcriptional regulator/MocR family aminotransferase